MKFQKGNKMAGSRLGKPNKTTQEIREAFQKLVSENLENMNIWVSKIAQDDPGKALHYFLEISERILPKLQRTDIDIKSGGEPIRQWTIEPVVKPTKRDGE